MEENRTEKPKKNVFGQIIKKLIFLAIIAACGYWIYKNGGLPKDGIDLGKMIGANPAEKTMNEEVERISESDIIQKMFEIDDKANQSIACGYSLDYYKGQNTDNNDIEIFTKITGINNFDNIVAISMGSNDSGYEGAFLSILIETESKTDAEEIAKQIEEYINPSDWEWIGVDYKFYENLTPEDVRIVTNNRYIYVILVGDELTSGGQFVSVRKSASKQQLIDAFYEVTSK